MFIRSTLGRPLSLLLAGVAAATGACEGPSPSHDEVRAAAPERRPGDDLLADIRAKSLERAYERMAPVYREATSPAQFRAAIEANTLLTRHTAARWHRATGGAGGHIEGVLETPAGSVWYAVHFVEGGVVSLLVSGVPVVGLGVPAPPAPAVDRP